MHVSNIFERQLFPGEHPNKKLEMVDFPAPVAPRTTILGLGRDSAVWAKICLVIKSKFFLSSIRANMAGSVRL